VVDKVSSPFYSLDTGAMNKFMAPTDGISTDEPSIDPDDRGDDFEVEVCGSPVYVVLLWSFLASLKWMMMLLL
jgi:hypothetical protein